MGDHRARSSRAPSRRARQRRRDGRGLHRELRRRPGRRHRRPIEGLEPLPIYDRRPESFGRDAYLLTNTAAVPSRYQGFEVTLGRDAGDHWFFRFGSRDAYLSEGVGANRGCRGNRTIRAALVKCSLTPNAATNARYRVFYNRACMMKVLGVYKGPGPLSASFVARYQDGQPFARVVVAEGLTQGAEIVQAYPRGGQRLRLCADGGCPRRAAVEGWRPPHGRRRGRGVQPAEPGPGDGGRHRHWTGLPHRDRRAAAARRARRAAAGILADVERSA